MPSDVDNEGPRPRLCHLIKWNDFNGYGFNLHAEKVKFGQFIGKVDEGSPAELAGLKEGDRIIEVNGVNVGNENHKQVVERIKAIPNETKLLVVDFETDKYYKSKKMVVKGTMPNITYLKTPPTRTAAMTNSPISNGGGNKDRSTADVDERSSQASSLASGESLNHDEDKLSRNGSNSSTPPIGRTERMHSSASGSPAREYGTPPLTPTTPTEGGASGRGKLKESLSLDGDASRGLNLNMTASEMRAMLATKKKYDPKKENLDLRKKHAIIQDM